MCSNALSRAWRMGFTCLGPVHIVALTLVPLLAAAALAVAQGRLLGESKLIRYSRRVLVLPCTATRSNVPVVAFLASPP